MKRLDELFDIRYGVNLEVVNCEVVDSGGIPFVSRQSVNNGISCYVREDPFVEPNPAGTLSIAGGGSVLSTFLQEEPYYSGRDIYVATPKAAMSREEMLYYCYVIEKNKYRYSYGRQANRTLREIRVPEYAEASEAIQSRRLPECVTRSVGPAVQLPDVSEWRAYRYDELFEIKKGKRLTKEDMVEGPIPFIGATDANNGITAWVANDDYLHDGNKITVSYNGSIAEAFYQGVPFVASDDVNVLYPKFEIDRFTALFICTLIRREKYRWNYGRKWHADKMRESVVRLPAAPDGRPGFALMRDYVKGLACSSLL